MRRTTVATLAVMLAATVNESAPAEGRSPTLESPATVSDRSPDISLDHSWWLPGRPFGGGKRGKLDRFLPPDSAGHLPAEDGRSLIEQAESLLETPRPEPASIFRPIDVEAPKESLLSTRNMFSHTWSDGAPLLLFDWSGKSAASAPPTGLKLDGVKRVADASTATDWANLSSKVKLRERDTVLDPTVRNAWESDETLKLPVAGAFFVFGQLGASTPDVEQRQYKWLGKTGVGVKIKPWLLQEVQVRGGPAVRYDDTEKLSPGQSPERSELFLEAVTKVPLPGVGPVNVEYTGYAVPAVTPADHNQVNQDFKLALPISGSGQFHVGAKYRWEPASSTPWMDRAQLYMGVQGKW